MSATRLAVSSMKVIPRLRCASILGTCSHSRHRSLKRCSRTSIIAVFSTAWDGGLPAALGAKFARPDQPAIALIGDGSFLFSNATLATAYEYDQPVVSIIMNNRSLLIERELMEKKYGRSAFVDYKKLKNNTPWGPDYAQIGRAMGAQSVRVEAPEDLVPAVRRAVDSGEPYVVDVDIDPTKAGYRNVWYPYPSDFWKSRYETETHF